MNDEFSEFTLNSLNLEKHTPLSIEAILGLFLIILKG